MFVVLCVSCSFIPFDDKMVGFFYIMPCRRQFDSLSSMRVAISEQGLPA